jgi:hypothetical protein
VADVELTFTGQSYVQVRKGKWGKARHVQLLKSARNLLLPAMFQKQPSERLHPYGRTKHGRDLALACIAAGTCHYSPHDL